MSDLQDALAELNAALDSRVSAGASLEKAAHALSRLQGDFDSASKRVLAAIPVIAAIVGARARIQRAQQWAGSPYGNDEERATRVHTARSAGEGAAASLEQRMCQAFGNGLARGSVAETIGLEFSTEAGVFMRAAAEVAAQRAPLTQPDGRFTSIITAQCNRVRQISQEIPQ